MIKQKTIALSINAKCIWSGNVIKEIKAETSFRNRKMIIRVQNKSRAGPYFVSRVSGHPINNMAKRHGGDEQRHPTPDKDIGIERWMQSNEYCGFANWEQFINWFTADELKMMAKHGYYPERIDTKPTVIGECQCLFVRRNDER